jgi:LysM repeat protein
MLQIHHFHGRVSHITLVFLVVIALLLTALPTAAIAAPAYSGGYHVVKAGETLSEIAKYHGVTLWSLVHANGIANPNHVYVGQRLYIPSAGSGYPGGHASCSTYHIVQKGDTLSGIAAWFGVSTYALASVNGIANTNIIRLGSRICIPSPYNGGDHHYPPPAHDGYYRVKAGDTLSKIARWHGTTVHHLMWLNGLSNPNYIYVGQVLQIG